jgi:hypothetical protein
MRLRFDIATQSLGRRKHPGLAQPNGATLTLAQACARAASAMAGIGKPAAIGNDDQWHGGCGYAVRCYGTDGTAHSRDHV